MAPIPETMRAVVAQGGGGPEVLQVVERPVPRPGNGEILVKVAAAGVNRPDVLQRQATIRRRPARRTSSGSKSPARSSPLGASERRAFRRATRSGSRRRAAAMPNTPWSHETQRAAGSGTAVRWSRPAPSRRPSSRSGPTSSSAARLKPGETLLVHGGTSGIGTTAIQLAKAFGATRHRDRGRGRRNARPAASSGADLAINYRDAGFRRRPCKDGDRRQGRRRHPRHGRRRPTSRATTRPRRGWPHRADRLPRGPQGRGRLPPAHGQAADPHGLDPARRARSRRRRRSPGRSRRRSVPLLARGPLPAADRFDASRSPRSAKAHAPMEGGEHIGKIVLTV